MKRFETEAAKQDAVDTLRMLMARASDDESYRGYSRHLDEVLARPVASGKCAFDNCTEDVEGLRSYCHQHSSVSWLAKERTK